MFFYLGCQYHVYFTYCGFYFNVINRLSLISKHAITYEGQNQNALIALFDVSTSTGTRIFEQYIGVLSLTNISP